MAVIKMQWLVIGVVLTLLAGCGGSGDEEQATLGRDYTTTRSADEGSETSSASEGQASTAIQPLEVTVEASMELRSDRRIIVAGQTNLPVSSNISVMVERELSSVRWRERTQVGEDGRFQVGPLGPGSGLPDGGYRIRVELMESSIQPENVRQRIGLQGENLAGDLVEQSRHGLGQVINYSRRFMIGAEPRRTQDQVEVLAVPDT
ncbi:MAG: hypothetical protein R6U42_08020 [Halomonas sp.]